MVCKKRFVLKCADQHAPGEECQGLMVGILSSSEMLILYPSKLLAEIDTDRIMEQPLEFRPQMRPEVIEVEIKEV